MEWSEYICDDLEVEKEQTMKPLEIDRIERNREWIRNLPKKPLKDKEKPPDIKKVSK